jgi:hypothetical protein
VHHLAASSNTKSLLGTFMSFLFGHETPAVAFWVRICANQDYR